jgi:hypothetical protein
MVGGFNSITICRSYDLVCMPHKYGAHYYYPVGIVGDINLREGGYPQGLKAIYGRLKDCFRSAVGTVLLGGTVCTLRCTKSLLGKGELSLKEVKENFSEMLESCSIGLGLLFFVKSAAHFFGQEHAKDNFNKDVVEIVMKRIYENCLANPSASLWSIGSLR